MSPILIAALIPAAPSACLPAEIAASVRNGTATIAAVDALAPTTDLAETACRTLLRAKLSRADDGGPASDVAYAAALQASEKDLPGLAPALRLLRAEVLATTNNNDASKAITWAKRKLRRQPSLLSDRLLLAEARSVEKFGSPKRVLAVARRLLRARAGSPAKALAMMEAAQRSAGDTRGADASLRKLLVEHPEEEAAKAKEHFLDDGTLLLEADEAADRIMGLIQASRMARAEKEALAFDRKRAPFGPERMQLEVATTQALVRAGRPSIAVDHIQKEILVVTSANGKHANIDELREAHAWALGKARRHDAAQKAWNELSLSAADEALQREACFLGGFLAYEVDRFDVAENEWKRCEPLLDHHPRGAQALWYRALMDVSSKRRPRAISRLKALVKTAPKDKEADKHLYWLAVMLDDGGTKKEKARAKKIWASVVKTGQTTYYAMLARRRLGAPPPQGAKILPDALTREAEVPKRIADLMALGYVDIAQAYARALGRSKKARAIQHWTGDAHHVWRRGARGVPYPRVANGKLVASNGWRASYAMPWANIVDDVDEKHPAAKVPRSFVYAIMRTESGFQADAVSVAGALGLLQLMPYTAVGIAGTVGLEKVPPTALVRPATNILLGMHFLSLLKREFGTTYLAAAAYNGDPRNVNEWMKRFQGLDVELFVERVPFRETRNYIKKVTATEAIYRALDGEPLTLDLPQGPIPPALMAFTSFKFTDDGDNINDDDD